MIKLRKKNWEDIVSLQKCKEENISHFQEGLKVGGSMQKCNVYGTNFLTQEQVLISKEKFNCCDLY